MNVPELEPMREKTVKASESNEKEPVYYIEYLNQPPFKSLRDLIIAQIKACENITINRKI